MVTHMPSQYSGFWGRSITSLASLCYTVRPWVIVSQEKERLSGPLSAPLQCPKMLTHSLRIVWFFSFMITKA